MLFVGASCEFAHDPRLPASWIFVGEALALGIIDVDTMRLPTPLVRWHFGLVAFALLIAAIGTRSLHHALVALGCMVFWGARLHSSPSWLRANSAVVTFALPMYSD